MRLIDSCQLAYTAIVRYPLRSSMLLLAIAIGVAAVLLLTSLGEGARRYVTGQFASLGTHLLIVLPGKFEVANIGEGMQGTLSGPPRPLTLDDAIAIKRSPYVKSVTAVLLGQSRLNYGGNEREVDVFGSTHNMRQLFQLDLARGQFLPPMALDNAASVAVIGSTIARELFGNQQAIGQWVRLGDRRLRVIGVLAGAGQVGGIEIDEVVFVPVAYAMQAFNSGSVHRLIVEATAAELMVRAKRAIVDTVKRRHQGNDDVTVLDQGAILATFNKIFLVLTSTLAGIASISLAVAGTLIMNVMLVAVSQRTEEIGLMKALGSTRAQIIRLFLVEAAMLSILGALLGVLLGQSGVSLLRELYPIVDFRAPDWAVIAAVLMAIVAGLAFGIMPARRAADLNPVAALAGR